MRPLIFAALACLCAPSAIAQANIRQVDFKNFSYPLKDHLLGHGELRWLSASASGSPGLRTVQLKNGETSGFTLQEVTYADVTGDGKEDAIVVLDYHSGGTQSTNYVYIYSLEAGRPKLLGYFHTGDRANSGLYAVYGERGLLVVELFDPEKQVGNCCSEGFVRTRYRWSNEHFKQFGSRQYGALEIKEGP